MKWPFQTPPGKLTAWDIAYFEHLIAELNALDVAENDPRFMRALKLIEAFQENEEKASRSSLLELEQTLLSLQPIETLLQRAPVLRLRYREVVGESQFAVYTPGDISKLPPSSNAVRTVLLPDLKNLVSGIHWRYILAPLLDKVQIKLVNNVARWVLFYTFSWILILFLTNYWGRFPFLSMLSTVVYAGIIGGYISALRRVQSVRPDTDSLLTIQALQNSRYFLWLSPLLGAIFAVVLLLIFLAKLVGGTVFPEFAPINSADSASLGGMFSWYFLAHLRPTNSEAYAKLFLWSFIAGFAERFVPDILDRVIQSGRSESSGAGSGGGGAANALNLVPASVDNVGTALGDEKNDAKQPQPADEPVAKPAVEEQGAGDPPAADVLAAEPAAGVEAGPQQVALQETAAATLPEAQETVSPSQGAASVDTHPADGSEPPLP